MKQDKFNVTIQIINGQGPRPALHFTPYTVPPTPHSHSAHGEVRALWFAVATECTVPSSNTPNHAISSQN